MYSLLLAAALALALPLQPATPEPEGDSIGGRELPESSANLDFIIFNRTGQTIVELNISPRGDESWSDNLLRHRDVPDQERAAAVYSRDVELCRWDIRVRFENGTRRSWPAVNLCDTVRVELR
ncbi:MAG TPA: hypothetical protein VMG08_01970 [Allosphingosinicella sp.]|nr:hypothetical protein [Allosphingosinicella sp.]